MAKLTRRALLTGGLACLTVLVAAPYAAYQYRYGNPADIVIAILRRRVGYLRTAPGSFERFANEYLAYKAQHREQLARLSIIALPFTYVTLYRWLPLGHWLRRLEDNVVGKYLLSTDFFIHGADESRRVEYLSFYEPHLAPCRNPFAHLRRSW